MGFLKKKTTPAPNDVMNHGKIKPMTVAMVSFIWASEMTSSSAISGRLTYLLRKFVSERRLTLSGNREFMTVLHNVEFTYWKESSTGIPHPWNGNHGDAEPWSGNSAAEFNVQALLVFQVRPVSQ
jgi:hypothetical protein